MTYPNFPPVMVPACTTSPFATTATLVCVPALVFCSGIVNTYDMRTIAAQEPTATGVDPDVQRRPSERRGTPVRATSVGGQRKLAQ